jgi:hypothetical protein
MMDHPPPMQHFFKTLLSGTECCIESTSLVVDRATTPDDLLLKAMRRCTESNPKNEQRNTIVRHHSHPVMYNVYALSAPLNPSRWDSSSQIVMHDAHASDSQLVDRTRGVSRYNSDPLVLTAPQRSSDNVPLIRYRYLSNNNTHKIDHESSSTVTTSPCELPIEPVSTPEPKTGRNTMKKRKKTTPTLPTVQEQVITWKRTTTTTATPNKKKQHTTMRRRKHTKSSSSSSSSSSSVSCVTKVLEIFRVSKFYHTTLYQPILLELLHVNNQVISGIQDLIKSAHMLFTTEIIPNHTKTTKSSSITGRNQNDDDDDDDDGIMLVLNVCGGDISPSCSSFFPNGRNKTKSQPQQRLEPEIFTI